MTIKITNLETLKKAIEIEIDNHYIDIRGKSHTFSSFMLQELKEILKQDKSNPKLKNLLKIFENYPLDNVAGRIKAVKHLINTLNHPEDDEPQKTKSSSTAPFTKTPDQTDVMYVKGVGPKLANIFNKMGIYTAEDLLKYYPRKYLDYSIRTCIADLEEGTDASIFGTIKSVNAYTSHRKQNLSIITIQVYDSTGTVQASWFYGKTNRYTLERYKSRFKKGANIILSGKVKRDEYTGQIIIDKPQEQILSGDFDENSEPTSLHLGRIVPVYPLSENLHIKTLRNAIHNAIEKYAEYMNEVLPPPIINEYNLLSKQQAIRQIHFPSSQDILDKARRRLIFEELFLIQLRLAYIRQLNKISQEGNIIGIKENGLVHQFINSLPFTLTSAQNNAFNEILKDLQDKTPMQRLLQGDVGSGKTVVACLAILSAIENGYQAALMAPTEILAEQHYKNFVNWLTPLGLSVGLFVGKHGAKVRREMRQNLKNGQIHLAIGTHALIQEGIEFNNLGLVVIDEQHRFGVKQRLELKNKGINPEMLTMTATPIPRTLALTVHGDLDITVIDELPKGRKPVKTALLTASERKKAYNLIKQEIISKNQVYIVFPLIEESETLSAKAATKEAKRLQEEVFPQYSIGLVHGKMPPQEKDEIMEDFRKGKYQILVSTTVIEVGVDVPNATVIIIENAERFGLSQLHQLRGRVGRSDKQSYCVLISNSKTPETLERLNIMTQTNDGFIIAEKDLQIRGPGEFMGTRQSGVADLLIADIANDTEILDQARKAAFDFISNNSLSDYPQLSKYIKNNTEMLNAG